MPLRHYIEQLRIEPFASWCVAATWALLWWHGSLCLYSHNASSIRCRRVTQLHERDWWLPLRLSSLFIRSCRVDHSRNILGTKDDGTESMARNLSLLSFFCVGRAWIPVAVDEAPCLFITPTNYSLKKSKKRAAFYGDDPRSHLSAYGHYSRLHIFLGGFPGFNLMRWFVERVLSPLPSTYSPAAWSGRRFETGDAARDGGRRKKTKKGSDDFDGSKAFRG